jgi:hypothetical protein
MIKHDNGDGTINDFKTVKYKVVVENWKLWSIIGDLIAIY